MKKYEAPCAVRLADTATGEFQCSMGTTGNPNVCNPTGGDPNHNLCLPGANVAVRR